MPTIFFEHASKMAEVLKSDAEPYFYDTAAWLAQSLASLARSAALLCTDAELALYFS